MKQPNQTHNNPISQVWAEIGMSNKLPAVPEEWLQKDITTESPLTVFLPDCPVHLHRDRPLNELTAREGIISVHIIAVCVVGGAGVLLLPRLLSP